MSATKPTCSGGQYLASCVWTVAVSRCYAAYRIGYDMFCCISEKSRSYATPVCCSCRAEPGLRFVPVPKVTGFAGYWEVDQERTTPHPQPIDVMIGASFIVRKVHKSIQGMAIGETDGQLTVAGQPTFMPPGLPAAYCEVYDKTNSAESTWTPRRDLKLGSCSGKIYMTDTGMVVLRIEARAAFSGRVEFIVEDYLTLEEGGQVIVDRMCCLEVATGRRATQLQVARLRPDKS